MARYTVRGITAVPTVSNGDADDPTWYPLQHAFGIGTFGVNLFVANRSEQILVEEHDERESGQQELYVILEGRSLFELDGEEVRLNGGTAVAVTDPSVRRSAKALTQGTKLLVVAAGTAPFVSTWNSRHFRGIPRPE